ncbi:MAG: beta-lactamase family protein [Fibromonadaceae bacterium]|jgi:CubicO group peptidase (beta-lactamase class C family)|nr:beta-lactamase family protein [Fibromonadaceae bacterium]
MHKTLFSTLALLTATLLLFSCGKHSFFDDVFDDTFEVSSSSVEGSSSSSGGVEESIKKLLLNFYEKHQLLGGVSIAISRNERLVYTGAVGYADSNHTIELTPEHRMRIASVSKPITSIAIAKLFEEGKLDFDDFVFGESAIFDNKYGMPTYNGNPVDVTVRQLLEHTSGGWSSVSGRTNIPLALENNPFEHLPGTQHVYSNFGYYILGRVIETISGMTYENYVKENILEPSGVNGMRVGATKSGPDEVEYIATPGGVANPSTYNNPVTMDSFGGWVANPIELLKILVRVDGFSNVEDILKNETPKIRIWNHSGSMPGTMSIWRRNSNGFNWVMMMNYRPSNSEELDRAGLFGQIINTIQEWPVGTEL